jgi:hypothetical protein
MNEDLTLYMLSQVEIDEMIAVGNLILNWFEMSPSSRILDHESPYPSNEQRSD